MCYFFKGQVMVTNKPIIKVHQAASRVSRSTTKVHKVISKLFL